MKAETATLRHLVSLAPESEAPPRRTYSPPRLTPFGTLTELTRNLGGEPGDGAFGSTVTG